MMNDESKRTATFSSFLVPRSSFDLARSYAYCVRLARKKAGNFYHAFRFLPGAERRAMCALYAFLREADDRTDEPATVEEKQRALAEWRAQFGRALAGEYVHPLHPALHHTMERFRIPRVYPDAVLDGVEMDLVHQTYGTFAELYRYCYRVASAVGLACIHIWGFTDELACTYAESAGIAFQLTNILRDLREDMGRGRIYLPQEDLDRHGYRAEALRRGERGASFRALMRFETERARHYYEAARPLIPLLRPAGRAVFQVMAGTYEGLLDAIEQRDYDVFSGRVRVSSWRKLGLVVQAMPVRWGWA
jgi:phytoene synthase